MDFKGLPDAISSTENLQHHSVSKLGAATTKKLVQLGQQSLRQGTLLDHEADENDRRNDTKTLGWNPRILEFRQSDHRIPGRT